jgi:hypothetical protein
MNWIYIVILFCLIGAIIYLILLHLRKKDKEYDAKEKKYKRDCDIEDEHINHLLKRFRLMTRYNTDADFGEWFKDRWK